MNIFSMTYGFGKHLLKQFLTGKKPTPLPEHVPAPDFEVHDETGKVHRLSDYRGKKVVLWFFLRASTPG